MFTASSYSKAWCGHYKLIWLDYSLQKINHTLIILYIYSKMARYMCKMPAHVNRTDSLEHNVLNHYT